MTPWNAWATALLIACCIFLAPRVHAADAACGPDVVGSPCAAAQTAGMESTGGVPQGMGNPVNLITGNKHQRETDMAALPGVLGLELVRHYNSRHAAPGMPLYGIGRGWQLSYDTRLYAEAHSLQVVQADGARIIFARSRLRMTLCASTDPAQGVVRIDPGEATGTGLRYRWRWPDGRELGFDRKGRLARISMASGEAVVIERLPDGRIAKVTDPQGRSLAFAYSRQRAGRYVAIQSVDTPVGRFFYDYGDPAGGAPAQAANLAQVQLPTVLEPGVLQSLDGRDHGPSTYSRSTVRRIYHYEDPRFVSLLTGITVDGASADGQPMRIASWAYDRNGLAVRAERSGEQLAFDRSAAGITRITDGRGKVTTYRHAIVAGAFRLLEARGAGCASCGQVDVRYGYDSLGRLQEVTRLDAAGHPLSGRRQERDALGRPYAVFDVAYRDGKQLGRTLSLQQLFPYPGFAYRWPGPRLPRSHYGPMRIAQASVIAGRQHERVITYNERQQPLTVTETGLHPDGAANTRITRYRYAEINGRSLLVEADGPLPNGPLGTPADSDITRYAWDAQGAFVTRITQPMGATMDIDYAPYTGRMARLTYRWENVVHQTRLDYHWDGQLARRLDIALAPDGMTELDRRELQVKSDALGQPGEVVWPDGGIETIERRLPPVSALQPLSGILTMQYADPLTAAAQEVLRYDAGSRSAERRFDDFGQVVAIRNPGQGWQYARYDAAGRLAEIRDPRGAITRVRHDAAGRLLQIDRALPGDAAPEQLDFTWRGSERQSEIVRIAGRQTHASHYRHTPWGQVSRMDVIIAGAHGGDVTLQVRSWYDPAGRLSARSLPGGERLAWRYYATAPYRGQRAAIERLRWPAMLDGLMDQVPEPWLDRLGLKTRLSDFAPQEKKAEESAGANADMAAPQAEPGLGVPPGAGHDAAGLPHTVQGAQGELTLRWNAAGQLAEVQAAGNQVARYRYDAHGRRASKHTAAGSEFYLYEGAQLLAVLQQANKAPSSLRHYVYDGLRPVAWLRDGIAYPLQTDQRGAVSAVLAPTGDAPRPVWRAGLDAWGRSQPDGPASLDPGLRLLHQYADLETGLSYHIARYYDPARGRFISPDAAGIPDSLGRDVPDALVLDLTAYAAGQPTVYIDPDGAARLVYYALTTDAKGKALGVTQGFTRARWAFSVDGIEASGDGGSDAVNKLMAKYAGNQTGLLYDLKGDFLGSGKSVASWAGASDETVDSFKKHYQSSLIALPQFVIGDYSNKDAALLIAALTKDQDGDNLCHDTPGLLPQIRFGTGDDKIVVTSARGVDANRPANLQRLVNCQVNTTTAFPVSYADDTERERVERIEAAAEMNETSGLNKDCSRDGCPGVTITGQPGPNNAPAREYHASYGRSQFVAATFIETLDKLPPADKIAVGITSDIQKRITLAKDRAVSNNGSEGFFEKLRKFPCGKAGSAWDDAGEAGALTEEQRNAFQRRTSLDRQAFIDMVCFVPDGNSKPIGEAKNAFMTESIFSDPVLKFWLMDLYKNFDSFNLVSRIFIRNNLREVLKKSDLEANFKNTESPPSTEKKINSAFDARQREIEEELAMRVARMHNGGASAFQKDSESLTRTCVSKGPRPCDQGDYVKTFIGIQSGRGDWRSLRCGQLDKQRGIQLMPLKI